MFPGLFDRINLDPGIPIKYVHTNQRNADILTKSSFSRERWSQLTQVFNLMSPHLHAHRHFSVLLSSVQKDDSMSQWTSASANLRLVRNLSAYVTVEKDHKADCNWKVERNIPHDTGLEQQSATTERAGKLKSRPLYLLQGSQKRTSQRQVTR